MFGLASGYYENYLKPPDVHILIIGLDGAGKTALLERLKVTEFKSSKRSNSGKRLVLPLDHAKKERNSSTDFRQANDGNDNDDIGDFESKSEHDLLSPKESHSNGYTISKLKVGQIRTSMCPTNSLSRKKQLDADNDEEYVYGFPSTVGVRNLEEREIICNLRICKGPSSNGDNNRKSTSSPSRKDIKQKYSEISIDKVDNGLKNDHSENSRKQETQYDLKANKTMFPLHLIKPTVGMNLAKLEGRGAKLKIMDLGGTVTMRPLWERYYADVHGVAFVVDISPTSPMSKLMESRAFYRCMRDDESLTGVPILIFGNKADERDDLDNEKSMSIVCSSQMCDAHSQSNEERDVEGDVGRAYGEPPGVLGGKSLLEITELFLSAPRGSALEPNPSIADEEVALYTGSAKTGQAVRSAFEWLIDKAKVVEKERRLRG